MLRPRLVALLAAVSLAPLALLVHAAEASPEPTAAAPAAHAKSRATIRFTEHGIPHITAKDFGSLGFGSGYAAAEASICNLADTVVTARGQRSRWFGPNKRYDDQVSMEGSNLQVDTLVADLHQRRVVEKVLKFEAGPGRHGRLATVTEDLYRTPQGYVIDDPAQFMGWSPISFWAIRDANGEQLRTIDTFLNMGKAKNVRDLLRRQDKGGGMPWVNTTAADRNGNVLYADHSVVPHVTNGMKARCLTPVGLLLDSVAGLPGLDGTRAESDCKWGTDPDAQRPGILGPQHLPDVIRKDWVMNANDSYWLPNPKSRLEGYPTIIGCERCTRTMRTRMVMQYVIDRTRGGRKETPQSFRGHEHANRVRAAEVMRANGDLDKLCRSTGATKACQVLRRWDGHSDPDSVGTHIFEEFISRVPPDGALWEVPFSADDPLNTPRDLNETDPRVMKAMTDAIAYLQQHKVPFDATWGSLQVAGDRGAPPIALGGGTGDAAGNANALASRNPIQNTRKYRPITYGSSHIQAISFLPGGRTDARTILTYSQDENPLSAYSSDQTRLFSRGKWVRFAWTDAQIRADLVRTVNLTG